MAGGHIDRRGLGKNVGIKADRHRLGLEQHRLRAVKLLFYRVDVVEDDTAVAELGLQLRHDVHAMDGDVLERRVADRHRRIQRHDVDGRDVVQLRVGHPTAGKLGRGPGRGDAAANPAGCQVVPDRRETRGVLAHGQHPRNPILGLRGTVKRLQMLGDMDQPAAVDPDVAGDTPAAKRFDQPVIAAHLFQGGFERCRFLFYAVQHLRAHPRRGAIRRRTSG